MEEMGDPDNSDGWVAKAPKKRSTLEARGLVGVRL
jgi:hypothetical protein